MDRRSFLMGLGALIAAPAIVRASSLMPVRGIIMPAGREGFAGYSTGARVTPFNWHYMMIDGLHVAVGDRVWIRDRGGVWRVGDVSGVR